MALVLPLLASLYLAQCHVSAQRLSPDPFINNSWNGEFTWPAGSTGSFDQGSPMGIAWQSPYQLVNIYLIWNQTVGKPIVNQCQVATGRPGNVTYDWTVSCAMPPNCGTDICARNSGEAPFVLRIVDADGDLHAVNDGGFWSREFWIQPLLSPSSTSAISSTTSTMMISSSSTSTINTSSSTTTSSQLSSSSGPTESSATSAKSSSFPKISASTTTSPFTPNPEVPTHLVTSTPSSSSSLVPSAAPSSPSSPLSHSVAIGVGVGVGVGAALLLGAAIFFLWRRRGRDHERQASAPPPPYPESNVMWDARHELYQPHLQPFKSEHFIAALPAEAPARDPQELDSRGLH
ncbi:hypothetical protein NU195Hw_Modified_346t1 [Hortaea werneckii]